MASKRYLRDGILDSEPVNKLTWAEEVFYRRLFSVVDDFGFFEARNSKLRTRLYSEKLDQVREADVETWKRACADAGLIRLYAVENKEYLVYLKFDQRIYLHSRPTCPPPPGWARPPVSKKRDTADSGGLPDTTADSGGLPQPAAKEREGEERKEEERREAETPASPPPTLPIFTADDVDRVLAKYPLKKAIAPAKYHVERALVELRQQGNPDPTAFLVEKVKAYAGSHEGQKKPKEARWWFQDKRWADDPKAWGIPQESETPKTAFQLAHPEFKQRVPTMAEIRADYDLDVAQAQADGKPFPAWEEVEKHWIGRVAK